MTEAGLTILAFLVGVFAGFADVITKYRDEPFKAAANRYGIVYLLLNGVIAGGVYLLFGQTKDGTGVFVGALWPDHPGFNAILVGSGAMLLLRSKVFTLPTAGGGDVSIGPAIILDALLAVLHRGIDRLRAAQRHELVFEKLKDLDDVDQVVQFFQSLLYSFQNLSAEDKAVVADAIAEITELELSNRLKIYAIGFAILTVCGDENFVNFVDDLKSYLQKQGAAGGVPAPSPPQPGGGSPGP